MHDSSFNSFDADEPRSESKPRPDFSSEEIRLMLASIRETIDALEDWEFPARTGFDRRDFDALKQRLERQRKSS